MNEDYDFLIKIKNFLNESGFQSEDKNEQFSENKKESQKKDNKIGKRREYFYSYRPFHDTIVESFIGKKSNSNIYLSKKEYTQIASFIFELIDLNGMIFFNDVKKQTNKYPCSITKIQTFFRTCVKLNVIKKTYMPGNVYCINCERKNFVFEAEMAWTKNINNL